MKLHLSAVALVLLAVPSCDKVRGLADKAKTAAGAGKATAATASVDVPAVRDLAEADFDAFTATPGRLVVVDFHAEWCAPCRQLGPVLEQVAGEFPGRVILGKVNVDHAKELARREGVNGIPDVRLYRDGKMVDKFVGGTGADKLRGLFERHGKGLEAAGAQPATPDTTGTPAPAIQPMKKDWLPQGIEKR